MKVLVFVEPADELSLQAVALARQLGDPVHGVSVGDAQVPVAVLHVAQIEGSYAPAAWAAAVIEAADGADAIVGPGSDRGNEVLAHVAARLDAPFAANCTAVDGDRIVRIRWGGSLYEEARLHGTPKLLTAAPYALVAEPAGAPIATETFTPQLEPADTAVRVLERVEEQTGGVALRDAKVVVSGGRGVGSAAGFVVIEELAELLGGAVGCSRVVTSAGWRPHTDQVGQTGTKISADLYVACGISGATQHIAGAKGAKKILAINADPEAPILASADYAVIGDLHEIVPAISAELRRVRAA
jgi:electron transfer flavoprotein alpha subunit